MNDRNITFHPLILGSDENAYAMARSFHSRYGIIPTLLCKQTLVPTRYSNIVEIRRFDDFDKSDVFAERLSEVAEEKKKNYDNLILVPCSDYYTELIVENPALAEKYFSNKFISPELLKTFATKEKFYEICEKYNLPYPKTYVCAKNDREKAADKLPFSFPVIVKADNSNHSDFLNSSFEGKKKVFFIRDKAEYLALVSNINSSNYAGNLIIQEFIAGGDTSMRVLNCFSDNDGKVRLMCLGRPVLEEYTPLNLGNYAAIMTVDCVPLCYKLKNFLEDVKYTGFSNFDMKYDPKDGEYKLFEINPRQGRSSFFVTASGFNLAEYLTENTVYGNPLSDEVKGIKHLWLTVPKEILYKYVRDSEVLTEVKRLILKKKYTYTLLYKKDMNIKRYAAMRLYYRRHIKDYKKYYFEKSEYGNNNV